MVGSGPLGARALALVAAFALIAASSVGASASTTDGMRGMLRIPSADVTAPKIFHGSIWGSYARGAYEASQSIRSQPETIKFGGSQLALGYAPSPRVELALRASAETQFLNSAATSTSGSEFGISNVGLGVKTVLLPGEDRVFRAAVLVDVASALGNTSAFAGSWDAEGVDVSGRLALTYAPSTSGSVRYRAHATGGYLNRTSDFDPLAFAITSAGPTPYRNVLHGDQFLYGTGLEVAASRSWTLFAEWSGEYDIESEAEFMDNPMRVTPGFRWTAPQNAISWTSGVDVSLASEEAGPSWEVVSGISFGAHFSPPAGRILGVVRDAESGAPVPNARVAARDGGLAANTDADGRFRADLEEGYAVLEISAEGYVTKTRVVEIDADGSQELDFTLPKRISVGSLQGYLRDSATGLAVAGRVRVKGTQEWVTADPVNGAYRIDNISEGVVVLECESDRHRTETPEARIVAGQVGSQDVSLVADAKASYGRVAGVVSDVATGKPVAALVTARGPSTKSVQSDPATGKYEIALESGSWEIVVAGTGYSARTETLKILDRERKTHDWTLPAVPPQVALDGVRFVPGTATIKRESFAALDGAARFLTDNPSVEVVIEGHTDEAKTAADNLALSQRRADAVLKYLVVNHGVDPGRLDARGVGASRPVAASDTEANRAKNRRIEMIVAPAASN